MTMEPAGGARYCEGWYPDPFDSGVQLRWFNGNEWTEHVTVVPPPTSIPATQAVGHKEPQPVAEAQAEATAVITIVSSSPNHLFHFVMTICTGGLWLPVWIGVAIWPRKTKVITRTSQN